VQDKKGAPVNRPTLDELRTAARQLPPPDLVQHVRALLTELLVRARADATVMLSDDDLAFFAARRATAAAAPLWPPPGVTVRLPSAPLAAPPRLTGGTWMADLPLRREELYDDRGRA